MVIFLLGGMVLSACNAAPSPSNLPLTSTPFPTSTPTVVPSPTPEAPIAVLLVQPSTDATLAATAQTLISDLAAQAGLRFQVRQALDPEQLAQAQVVVVLPPDPGLAALAEAAPETQFLALDLEGVEASKNVSIIQYPDERLDQLGFLAGFTAAIITPDWRVGVISEAETPAGKAARLGFINGVRYFCGLCLAVYPPYPPNGYPLTFDLSPAAEAETWQAAITYFKAWQVNTVFVAPSIAQERLLAQLADEGFNLILGQPPAPQWREHWVASLGVGDLQPAIAALWPHLLAGQGGQQVVLPLGFTAVNPDLLSPGRQGAVEEMLADLLAGAIDSGVDPQTGESRY